MILYWRAVLLDLSAAILDAVGLGRSKRRRRPTSGGGYAAMSGLNARNFNRSKCFTPTSLSLILLVFSGCTITSIILVTAKGLDGIVHANYLHVRNDVTTAEMRRWWRRLQSREMTDCRQMLNDDIAPRIFVSYVTKRAALDPNEEHWDLLSDGADKLVLYHALPLQYDVTRLCVIGGTDEDALLAWILAADNIHLLLYDTEQSATRISHHAFATRFNRTKYDVTRVVDDSCDVIVLGQYLTEEEVPVYLTALVAAYSEMRPPLLIVEGFTKKGPVKMTWRRLCRQHLLASVFECHSSDAEEYYNVGVAIGQAQKL